MPSKQVRFDAEAWQALDLLTRDRRMDFQELADEASMANKRRFLESLIFNLSHRCVSRLMCGSAQPPHFDRSCQGLVTVPLGCLPLQNSCVTRLPRVLQLQQTAELNELPSSSSWPG